MLALWIKLKEFYEYVSLVYGPIPGHNIWIAILGFPSKMGDLFINGLDHVSSKKSDSEGNASVSYMETPSESSDSSEVADDDLSFEDPLDAALRAEFESMNSEEQGLEENSSSDDVDHFEQIFAFVDAGEKISAPLATVKAVPPKAVDPILSAGSKTIPTGSTGEAPFIPGRPISGFVQSLYDIDKMKAEASSVQKPKPWFPDASELDKPMVYFKTGGGTVRPTIDSDSSSDSENFDELIPHVKKILQELPSAKLPPVQVSPIKVGGKHVSELKTASELKQFVYGDKNPPAVPSTNVKDLKSYMLANKPEPKPVVEESIPKVFDVPPKDYKFNYPSGYGKPYIEVIQKLDKGALVTKYEVRNISEPRVITTEQAEVLHEEYRYPFHYSNPSLRRGEYNRDVGWLDPNGFVAPLRPSPASDLDPVRYPTPPLSPKLGSELPEELFPKEPVVVPTPEPSKPSVTDSKSKIVGSKSKILPELQSKVLKRLHLLPLRVLRKLNLLIRVLRMRNGWENITDLRHTSVI